MISYDDLKGSLVAGNACAFVSAGLSTGAGLPGWYGLIAELAARIGYKLLPPEWATSDALIDAAQAYVNRLGLHGLISRLKDRLDTTGVQPTEAHRALARLPISLIFTTNFDDLLERAFRDAGKRVEVVTRDSSIPFMRRGPDTVNIVSSTATWISRTPSCWHGSSTSRTSYSDLRLSSCWRPSWRASTRCTWVGVGPIRTSSWSSVNC